MKVSTSLLKIKIIKSRLCVGLLTGFVMTGGFLVPTVSAKIPDKRVSQGTVVVNQKIVNGIPMIGDSSVPTPPQITSQAAVLMDLSTGTVLYAKSPLTPEYPASLTKVLTALLALQHGHLNDELVTHPDALNVPPDKLYLVPGERESLKKLLYGLLLISANDAAIVIADHYGGSVAGFASMMNREARLLGATHTHFLNPNGLPDSHHVTTAYDLALITRRAMQIPEFRRIVKTKSYVWHGQAWSSNLTNINHMLFTYPGAIGVKTGWTSAANQTLIAAATRGKETYLAVLLNNPSGAQINTDATNLLNYGFDDFSTVRLQSSEQPVTSVAVPSGKRIPLVLHSNIVATVLKTDRSHFTWSLMRKPVKTSLTKRSVAGWLSLQFDNLATYHFPLYPAKRWMKSSAIQHDDELLLLVLIGFVVFMLGYNRRNSRRNLRTNVSSRRVNGIKHQSEILWGNRGKE